MADKTDFEEAQSDPDIEAAGDAVQDLSDDIADLADKIADDGEWVADKFVEEYELSED